jgi:hypothetical protein
MDLLKLPHKNNDQRNEKEAKFNAINFNNFVSRDGVNINNKIPIIGNTNK